MKVAVVGCLHGELDIIYERIAQIESQQNTVIDILLVCGDFQTIRNNNDLKCMAVPNKYKQLGTFHNYYFGEKRASKLTILIGGNHEASNYLQGLPYGGWVAPNMYYLGYCSVIQFGGLRIGGISGIFKFHHAKMGHFECLPYNNDTMRSVYHMRETEVYKLLQLTGQQRIGPASSTDQEDKKEETDQANLNADVNSTRKAGLLDVFMSHDWPLNIDKCGNLHYLLKKKPYFRNEVNEGKLGNPLLEPLVRHLRPKHWFAAHLHVGYQATVNHPPPSEEELPHCTQFQSLDKVLPNRHFLQMFDIFPEQQHQESSGDSKSLSYDPEWLAILKKTDHLMNVERQQVRGIDIFNDQNKLQITEEDIKEIYTLFNNDLKIPDNFSPCEPVPDRNVDNDPHRQKNFINPQTAKLCKLLSIADPNQMVIDGEEKPIQVPAQPNPDSINLSDSEEDEEATQPKVAKLDEPALFVIDTKGNRT